jgi:hypothetical protein
MISKIQKRQGGFAFIVFIIIMAMSLMLMIINYSENEKRIADNVREIIKTERDLQNGLLCVGRISNILSRYPLLNDDLILHIRDLNISELDDKNYWVNGYGFSNYKGKDSPQFNCRVLSFNICDDFDCNYKAVVLGDGDDGDESRVKIYIEWKIDEHRFYVSKLNLIN